MKSCSLKDDVAHLSAKRERSVSRTENGEGTLKEPGVYRVLRQDVTPQSVSTPIPPRFGQASVPEVSGRRERGQREELTVKRDG